MGMFDKIKKFRPMDYFESAQGLDGMQTGDQLMADYKGQGIDFSEGSQIYDRGSQMMERGSAYNQQARASMQNNASDSQAESFRQSERLAAMGGGVPTGVITAQNMQGANNMQANASAQFENQFAQNQNQGVGILSGAMNNQAQIMQQGQQADQARRMAKTNASQQFMGVLGSGLKMAAASQGATTGQRGGSVSAAPKGYHYMPNGKLMKNSAMKGYLEGGPVGYNEGGQVEEEDPENPKPLGNGESDKDSMLRLAMEEQKRKDSNFMYGENVSGYEDMRAGEGFKGMVKGTLAGNVVGGMLGSAIPGVGLPATIAGGLFGRYKARKRFEKDNEGGFNAEDRARVKEIRARRKAGYQQGGMVKGYNHGGMVHPTNDFEDGGGPLEKTEEEKAEYNRLLEKNNQLNRVSSREDEEAEAGIRNPEYEASSPNSAFPEMQEVGTPDMPTGRGY